MFRPRLSSWTVLGLLALAASVGHAQTLVWIGGFPDENFSSATNWFGGAPLNNGTETLAFAPGTSQKIVFDVPVNLLEITVDGSDSASENVTISGTQPLNLGTAGIQINSLVGDASSLTIAAPVTIASPQNWSLNESGGFLTVNGAVTGTASLTLTGFSGTIFTLGSAASAYTGGTTLTGIGTTLVVNASSTGPGDLPTQGPVGTGTLSLGSGTQLTTAPSALTGVQSSNIASGTSLATTVANTIVAGDASDSNSVTFGGNSQSNNGQPVNLILTGTITPFNIGETYQIGANSNVLFQGTLGTTFAGSSLNFASESGPGSNSVADIQGSISPNYNALNLSGTVSLILDGSGPSQISGLTSFSPGADSYLGFGSTYAASGSMTTVLGQFNSTNSSASFQGTLGFDSTSGTLATFNDPIDLTSFSNAGFVGLGSATATLPGVSSVILGASAVITPPGGDNVADTAYVFGGGGGVLTVQSPFVDGNLLFDSGDDQNDLPNPRTLNLNGGNAPLTLILSGALSYTGGTNVDGGVLIFDTPPPATGTLALGLGAAGTGYIGATANANIANPQTLVTLLSGTPSGVIGFDSLTTGATMPVTGNIDLTGLGSVYLGTATNATYSGTITPAASTYQFASVKGGVAVISSQLVGTNAALIGLPTPLESFGSQSSVELSNINNDYSGGTTLQSGFLYVTNPASLGTGSLIVPDYVPGSSWGQTLATPSGTPVTLTTPIEVPQTGLALNPSNGFASDLTPGTLTLSGVISNFNTDAGQLGIFGPVDLENANTYSGGTTISTQGALVTVGNDAALGTGPVTATASTLLFTSGSPQLSSFSLSGSAATFNGNPVIDDLAIAEASTLTFDGTNAFIVGMKSDEPNSGNAIVLGSGTGLIFQTLGESPDNSPNFHGVVSGATGTIEVTNGFQLNLSGPNTYGGGTLVDAGGFLLASSDTALGTGTVTVNGILATNTGITLTNPVNVTGGTLGGFGTYSPGGTLFIEGGAGIVAGRAGIAGANAQIPIAGLLSFGNTTRLNFGPTGTLTFALTDANGTAGVGYGSIDATGGLTVSATALNPFTITLVTFDPTTNLAGNALNFNPANSYTWTLVNATPSTITNFNPAFFTIDHSQFMNPTGFGGFFLSKVGKNLDLNFTPVPEPSTWILLASGLGAFGAAFRRRRR